MQKIYAQGGVPPGAGGAGFPGGAGFTGGGGFPGGSAGGQAGSSGPSVD